VFKCLQFHTVDFTSNVTKIRISKVEKCPLPFGVMYRFGQAEFASGGYGFGLETIFTNAQLSPLLNSKVVKIY